MDVFVRSVAEYGFEDTDIHTVCELSGVTSSEFNAWFGSKEALFVAAYDAGVDILLEAASDAFLEVDGSWLARVRSGLSALLHALADNPEFARFFVLEIHNAGGAQTRIARSIDAASNMFVNVQPADGLAIPEQELVPLVVGAIYGEIYFYIRTGRISELPLLTAKLTDFANCMFDNADFVSSRIS